MEFKTKNYDEDDPSLYAPNYFTTKCFATATHAGTAKKEKKKSTAPSYPEALYSSLEYREIGPFRGGRSSAVTGVPGQPKLFYFGATGGGV